MYNLQYNNVLQLCTHCSKPKCNSEIVIPKAKIGIFKTTFETFLKILKNLDKVKEFL